MSQVMDVPWPYWFSRIEIVIGVQTGLWGVSLCPQTGMAQTVDPKKRKYRGIYKPNCHSFTELTHPKTSCRMSNLWTWAAIAVACDPVEKDLWCCLLKGPHMAMAEISELNPKMSKFLFRTWRIAISPVVWLDYDLNISRRISTFYTTEAQGKFSSKRAPTQTNRCGQPVKQEAFFVNMFFLYLQANVEKTNVRIVSNFNWTQLFLINEKKKKVIKHYQTTVRSWKSAVMLHPTIPLSPWNWRSVWPESWISELFLSKCIKCLKGVAIGCLTISGISFLELYTQNQTYALSPRKMQFDKTHPDQPRSVQASRVMDEKYHRFTKILVKFKSLTVIDVDCSFLLRFTLHQKWSSQTSSELCLKSQALQQAEESLQNSLAPLMDGVSGSPLSCGASKTLFEQKSFVSTESQNKKVLLCQDAATPKQAKKNTTRLERQDFVSEASVEEALDAALLRSLELSVLQKIEKNKIPAVWLKKDDLTRSV